MTDKDIKLIKEMFQMQAKLDEAIMKEYGLEEIEEEKLNMAILDEVGELTHELKATWCWWKKTQAPVDDKKVLGELVDVWHFVLSYQNNFYNGTSICDNIDNFLNGCGLYIEMIVNEQIPLSIILCDIIQFKLHKVHALIAITEYLGFTIEQVYEAYCEKNKINYQRLKEGY